MKIFIYLKYTYIYIFSKNATIIEDWFFVCRKINWCLALYQRKEIYNSTSAKPPAAAVTTACRDLDSPTQTPEHGRWAQ